MIVNVIFLLIIIATVICAALFLFTARRKNGELKKADVKEVISITGFGILFEVALYVMIKFILRC